MVACQSTIGAGAFDAVVIGAGPAGSVSAHQLARSGLRTLLIERRGLPRPKVCGGCLAPAGVTRLRGLGMIDEGFDRSHGTLSTLRLCSARGSCTLPIRAYRSVDRGTFDESLVERATDAGVEVLTNARATVRSDDRVLVEAGTTHLELAPRVVVVADGLDGSALAERADFGWRDPPRGPLGLGAIVPASWIAQDPGEIRMALGADGYVGFATVAPGVVAVGAALSAEAVKQLGPSPTVRGVLANARVDGEWVDGARWRGVARLTRARARYARGRVIVVGDAAQYVEPLTGEGMSWAILCASSVVPYAERVVRGADVDREWTRFCRRSLRSRELVCRAVSRIARSPCAIRAITVLATRNRIPGAVSRGLCWESG